MFACVYLCVFGPAGVWLGPRAQNTVQTHTHTEGGRRGEEEKKKKKKKTKKKGRLSRRQTRTLSWLNQKHKTCLFRETEIRGRIRGESRRKTTRPVSCWLQGRKTAALQEAEAETNGGR